MTLKVTDFPETSWLSGFASDSAHKSSVEVLLKMSHVKQISPQASHILNYNADQPHIHRIERQPRHPQPRHEPPLAQEL